MGFGIDGLVEIEGSGVDWALILRNGLEFRVKEWAGLEVEGRKNHFHQVVGRRGFAVAF